MSTTTTKRTRGEPGLDFRSTLGQVTQKAPRSMGRIAASILFVVMVVVGLVALFQSQSDRVEVLVMRDPVPAGQVVTAADVAPAEVAGVEGRSPRPTSTRWWASVPPGASSRARSSPRLR